MPARSSARGRKGEEPPEKASTSKMLSRETPSPSPAGAASTPSTRSMTLAKKTGESKTLPSIVKRTPTAELSSSNSRVSSPPHQQPLRRHLLPKTNRPPNLSTQSGKFPLTSEPRRHFITFWSSLSA
jgi:hypothetical protein